MKRNFVLGLYNRVNMGIGHGWAAVHSFLWNCDVDATYGKIGLQQPPTAQNYAIGCFAKAIMGNPVSATNFTKGYTEGQNKAGLIPESLYETQLSNEFEITTTVSKHFVNVTLNNVTVFSGDSSIQLSNITGKILLNQ